MLYILYLENHFHDYILDGINCNNKIDKIKVLRAKIDFPSRVFRKFLSIINISHKFPILYFDRSFINAIKKISNTDKVFIFGITVFIELKILNNLLETGVEKFIWHWNPLVKEFKNLDTSEIKRKLKKQNNLGYKHDTFDINDSIVFQMELKKQFYRMPRESIQKFDITNDFFFVGYEKDRLAEIMKLKEQLLNLNFRVKFLVIKDKTEEIMYYQVIENILHSKCIVDIIQNGQSGISTRPLEAIFFNKKLLTNNRNIVNEDFYHPNNIFIFGLDDMKLLNQFMGMDCIKQPDYILNKYEINKWMESYL